MAITTSSATPTGTYTLTITATSGSLTNSTQVALTVADFSLSASPSSQTVTKNSNATYALTVSALGPFHATVTFSVSGLPARTSASFSPSSVPGSGSSQLTISPKGKTTSGTYVLTVTATGGGLIHSTNVNLVEK
jgi:uncharacterized membrane protein